MAKVKILIVCLCALLSFPCVAGQSTIKPNAREAVIGTAIAQSHVREASGNNDGIEVEKYLVSVNLKKGNPWCAAFVSWCLQQVHIVNPKSGWSPNWFPASKVIYTRGNSIHQATPQAADVFGIWFPERKRIAHVGFILQWSDKTSLTIEGNTNEAGSREGDGVYRKRRLARQIYKVSSWI